MKIGLDESQIIFWVNQSQLFNLNGFFRAQIQEHFINIFFHHLLSCILRYILILMVHMLFLLKSTCLYCPTYN